MKIGLDTSVVVRLLTGEPGDQARRALVEVEYLRRRGTVLVVSDLVISEVYFALQYHYGVPKVEALRCMELFLAKSGVAALGAAASVLRLPNLATAEPGFVDRLIHAEYMRSAKEVLTFEKSGARLPGVRVLAPS
mgnify:CR=1 FL=1